MRLLVFLHGLGQTPQSWQDQVTFMPPGYRAVAPWLRGTRPGRDEQFTVCGAADDVLALLNTHGVEQMALVGVNLGALVALDAAVRAPEAVSHLVLAAGQLNPPKSVVRMQKMVFRMAPARHLASMGVEKRRFLQALDQAASVDHRKHLREVAARTLVIVGANDRAALPSAQALTHGIYDARLEVLPGVGHSPNTEAPEDFNHLLYGFLDED